MRHTKIIMAAGIVGLALTLYISHQPVSAQLASPTPTMSPSPTVTPNFSLSARSFSADLTGQQEVPPVATAADGTFSIRFARNLSEADFRLRIDEGQNITQAHLHCAPAGSNGPVVAHLFGNIPGGFDVDGELADFTLTAQNIVADAGCSPAITSMADLRQAIAAGTMYANVHSVEQPAGLIRGQVE